MGDDGDDKDKDTVLMHDEAIAWAARNKIDLPKDMLKTAKACGVRLTALNALIALRSDPIAGALMRAAPWIRNRLIADNRFLFKVFAEVMIDTGATRGRMV